MAELALEIDEQKATEAREEVARVAYRLWEERGRVHGFDVEHWLEAERLLAAAPAQEVHVCSKSGACRLLTDD